MEFKTIHVKERSGAPLAGASVYVYTVETSTPQDVFDENGGALTQPLTTGADGNVSFAKQDGACDIVAISGDTTLRIENVMFYDPADAEALTDRMKVYDSRAEMVAGYIDGTIEDGGLVWDGTCMHEASAGATVYSDVTGLVPSGGADWIYPDHFGSNTTPGTTVMHTHIQSALDYAGSLTSVYQKGATVHLRNAHYRVEGTLNMLYDQVTFDGHDGCLRRPNDGTGGTGVGGAGDYGDGIVVAKADPDTYIRFVTVRNLFMFSAGEEASGVALKTIQTDQCNFENIYIQDPFSGVEIRGGTKSYYTNINHTSGQRYTSLQSGSFGLHIRPHITAASAIVPSSSVYINNFQSNADHTQTTPATDVRIEYGMWIRACDGVYLNNIHPGFSKYCVAFEPYNDSTNIQHFKGGNWYIDGNSGMSTYGVWFKGPTSVASGGGLYKDITFSEVTIAGVLGEFIRWDGSPDRVQFSNFGFDYAGGDGISYQSGAAPTNVSYNCGSIARVQGTYDLRFSPGTTAIRQRLIDVGFLSSATTYNIGFGGSETFISAGFCHFSKTSLGGTTSGKQIRIIEATGLTTDFAEEKGVASGVTPNGSGDVAIAHTLLGAPVWASASLETPTAGYYCVVQGRGATNLTVRVYDSTDTPYTAGILTFDIAWRAEVA